MGRAVRVAPVLCALLLGGAAEAQERELLANGGFEEGLAGWGVANDWYIADGDGLSEASESADGAHGGASGLELAGANNRGIAIQTLRVSPDLYRVSGWLRCEGLDEAQAVLQVEWKGEGDAYLGAAFVGSVTGATGWTRVEAVIEAPYEALTMLVELLTTAPNSGRAWFDDISVTDPTSDPAPPPAVVCTASAPDEQEGAVLLDWGAYAPPGDVAGYDVYVSREPLRAGALPAPVRTETHLARQSLVTGLEVGVAYHAAVAPFDQEGNRPAEVKAVTVRTEDRRAPAPVSPAVEPLIAPNPSVLARWSLDPFENAPAATSVLWRVAGDEQTRALSADGAGRLPLTGLPASAAVEVAVVCQDAHGNASEPIWTACATPPVGADEGLRVATSEGAPIGGAEILAFPADGRGAGAPVSDDAPPGVYRLVARAEGWTPSRPVYALLGEGEVNHRFVLSPEGAGGVRVWATSALDKVFRDDAPPAEPGSVDLLSTRGESETAQVVIRCEEDLGPVSVWADALVHEDGEATIPASAVRASFVGYVTVAKNSSATPVELLERAAPADFPDELLDVESLVVSAGQCQPVLLRVDTPRDAAPGVYRGTVWVSTEAGSYPVEVRHEVLHARFPERTRLLVTNWFSTTAIAEQHGVEMWSEAYWRVLRAYADMMAAHHQNIAWAALDLVQVCEEPDGSFTYDFSRFDRWVELFDEAGVGARIELGHYGGRTTGEWECPTFTCPPRPATRRSDGDATTVPNALFAHALQEYLREKGWLERSMQHIADEPIPVNEDSWRERSREIHAAAPDLRRIDAVHVTDLDGDLEVWVPQLNFFDEAREALAEKHKAGIAEVWFYIAWVPQGKYPNRLIDMQTIRTRIVHWMNYLYDAPGYLHWGWNWWNIEFGHFAPGDEWIIWPSDGLPHSSLRYEAQREGIEDHEHLCLLEDLLREAGDADPSARSRELGGRLVRSITDYEMDPERFESVRRELLREVDAAWLRAGRD